MSYISNILSQVLKEVNKLSEYKEEVFRKDNIEQDLEILLENNPEYFFETSNVLIIGRQVTTNLNSFIDLLGIDKNGNSVIIELKRDRTPRDTVAQILEYASFIENLDYNQLNEIFKNYFGDEVELEDYHQQFFKNNENDKVSFNKQLILLIVAQYITKEIKQTAIFLRKNGININCLEFKYFQTKTGEKIITSDYVIGDEEYKKQEIKSASLPKINENEFIKSLDKNGQNIFFKLFEFAKSKKLSFIWGSKGFSLNINFNNEKIALLFGYPPNCVFKQSIYTGFENIIKKVEDSEKIVEIYRNKLEKTGLFTNAGDNIKWLINKDYNEKEIGMFLEVIKEIIDLIIEKKGAFIA
jgi:hypothetical protein